MQAVIEIIKRLNSFLNEMVWGVPALLLIGLVGIYYTVKLKGFQFVHFKEITKRTIGRTEKSDESSPRYKQLSSFQAAMTSVSAVVGSGNIAGVATAIVCGGPGALFWMILAALIGMATKYAEIILGMLYRRENADGSMEGGAMYYLADGLHLKWLGKAFSILVIPFAFVISAVVDTNTIANTLDVQYSVEPLFTGILLAVVVGIIIFGGLQRIGKVCEWLSPIMGGLYVLAGIIIIITNLNLLPNAIYTVICGAFNPRAVTGGAVGSIFICLKYGVARGVFSNEAGLGTTAMIHSGAKANHPVEQGIWGPMEVFLDTIVICTVTALAIIMSGLWSTGEYEGAALTMQAFYQLLPGKLGLWICLGAIILFGFSSLISCYTYAQRAANYLFGSGNNRIIKILWICCIVIGSVSTLGFVWALSDTLNGMMIIPNLLGLMLLRKEVIKAHNSYWKNEKRTV